METPIINPVGQNKRIVIVDILRGWALLGVVLMNYTGIFFFMGSKPNPDTFNKFLIQVGFCVFDSKSWTMLSFLFGYGFAVLMDNVASKGINPTRFFLRRMFWLLVIAFVNSAIWFGDILKDYAIFGMFLLLFRNVSAKAAFYISMALLLVNPPLTAFILSFGRLAENKEYIKRAFWLNLGIALVLWVPFGFPRAPWLKEVFKYFNTEPWLFLSTMIFITSAICRLYLAGKLKRFFGAFSHHPVNQFNFVDEFPGSRLASQIIF
jgi:uncharacterized membrane protein YeiB